jgi:hypothetical protein
MYGLSSPLEATRVSARVARLQTVDQNVVMEYQAPSSSCSVLGFAPDAFLGDVYNLVRGARPRGVWCRRGGERDGTAGGRCARGVERGCVCCGGTTWVCASVAGWGAVRSWSGKTGWMGAREAMVLCSAQTGCLVHKRRAHAHAHAGHTGVAGFERRRLEGLKLSGGSCWSQVQDYTCDAVDAVGK